MNEVLGRLADAPVPSNFTARVLQAVEQAEAAEARTKRGTPFWRWVRWAPRIAFAAIVLCAGLISYEQIQARQNRERIGAVKTVAEGPSPEVLKDYNAIQALSQTPADEELLTALK